MKKFLFVLILLIIATPIHTVQARPTHLRVGLIERFNNRPSINISNTTILFGHEFLHASSGFTVRPDGGSQMALYDGGQRLRTFGEDVQIFGADPDALIHLDGVAYRGAVSFIRPGSGVTAVNVVSIEEYLFSVVPSEMPATWHPEALKAQSVAARTYAFHTLARGNAHTGFDLCDLICCQVYRGVSWEHESSTQAVLATAGLAAFFNGQLIEAVYFASSGGVTENSENVWIEARPYLRSVSDPHEFEPVVWQRTFTLSEITRLLTQNNRNIGTATGVAIRGVHPSGRVESLVIQGTGGQVVLEQEAIRTFFSQSEEGSLRSRNFTLGGSPMPTPLNNVTVFDGSQVLEMSPLNLHGVDAQGNPVILGTFSATNGLTTAVYGGTGIAQQPVMTSSGDVVVITGRGFGHGVGMSQRGAEGMARRGYTFRQILTHFYTGITIE